MLQQMCKSLYIAAMPWFVVVTYAQEGKGALAEKKLQVGVNSPPYTMFNALTVQFFL